MSGFHNEAILKVGVMSNYWSGCGKRDEPARAAMRVTKQVGPVRSAGDVQIKTLLLEGVLVERFQTNVWKNS